MMLRRAQSSCQEERGFFIEDSINPDPTARWHCDGELKGEAAE